MKKGYLYTIGLVVLAFVGFCVWAYNDTYDTPADLVGTYYYFDNSDSAWYQVILYTNGKYDAWGSSPGAGEWVNHCSGSYTVSEERSPTTGVRCFCVELENSRLLVRNIVVIVGDNRGNANLYSSCFGGSSLHAIFSSKTTQLTPKTWRN